MSQSNVYPAYDPPAESDRSYQRWCYDLGCQVAEAASPPRRVALEAPPGAGKTRCAARLTAGLYKGGLSSGVVVAPVTSTHAAFYSAATGITPPTGMSDEATRTFYAAHGIMTPALFVREAAAGRLDHVDFVITDEGHHWTEESAVAEAFVRLPQSPLLFGFSATWYRMTPASSAGLRAYWGKPFRLVSLHVAIDNGLIVAPEVIMQPLLDDDMVNIGPGGEFQISSLEKSTGSRLSDLAELAKHWHTVKPTAVIVPSVELAVDLSKMLGDIGRVVVGDTSRRDRETVYQDLADNKVILVAVNVIGEGWDLPALGCLIDAKPTMSPVLWYQTFCRLSRPYKDVGKTYVCTNRNLERHAFLLAGVLPDDTIAEAQAAFPPRTTRSPRRQRMLEGIGRFAANPLPLSGGITGECYHLSVVEASGGADLLKEIVLIVDPRRYDVVWLGRQSRRSDSGKFAWSKWTRVEPATDLRGFTSARLRNRPLSTKQLAWWERSAESFGLDKTTLPESQAVFAVLPALVESRTFLGRES